MLYRYIKHNIVINRCLHAIGYFNKTISWISGLMGKCNLHIKVSKLGLFNRGNLTR